MNRNLYSSQSFTKKPSQDEIASRINTLFESTTDMAQIREELTRLAGSEYARVRLFIAQETLPRIIESHTEAALQITKDAFTRVDEAVSLHILQNSFIPLMEQSPQGSADALKIAILCYNTNIVRATIPCFDRLVQRSPRLALEVLNETLSKKYHSVHSRYIGIPLAKIVRSLPEESFPFVLKCLEHETKILRSNTLFHSVEVLIETRPDLAAIVLSKGLDSPYADIRNDILDKKLRLLVRKAPELAAPLLYQEIERQKKEMSLSARFLSAVFKSPLEKILKELPKNLKSKEYQRAALSKVKNSPSL